MGLKKIVGKMLGIGEEASEVDDFLNSVKSMAQKEDEASLAGRRGRGTQAYGGEDLIKIGNRLVQKLRASGDDSNLKRVSDAVFTLGKARRRR